MAFVPSCFIPFFGRPQRVCIYINLQSPLIQVGFLLLQSTIKRFLFIIIIISHLYQ